MAQKSNNGGNTVAIVTDLVTPIAQKLGISIWDVRFEKEGSLWYLRVFLDRPQGISLHDCESVSRPLSDALDELDPIEQSYYLEVSSAGIERELKKPAHFLSMIGQGLDVKLIRPRDGVRDFQGLLTVFEDGHFTVQLADRQENFACAECAYVKSASEELEDELRQGPQDNPLAHL